MSLRPSIAAAAAAFALSPLAALAVDGVILIDQNKALAGNVTPGDAAGFPVTITAPGSYRLIGNLTAPSEADGIVIAADGVTLDLNGFSISGSGVGSDGVTDNQVSHSRIGVRNGHISGFIRSVRLSRSSHVVLEDLMLAPASGGSAIIVGAFSRMHRNTVVGDGLIQATCPSIVIENISDGYFSFIVLDSNKQCIRYHNRSLNYGNSIAE